MNPAAILALIGDLYQQIATLTEENKGLREGLEQDLPPGMSRVKYRSKSPSGEVPDHNFE
jgi:hypothetical protein